MDETPRPAKKERSDPTLQKSLAAVGLSAALVGGTVGTKEVLKPEIAQEQKLYESQNITSAAALVERIQYETKKSSGISDALLGKIVGQYLFGDRNTVDTEVAVRKMKDAIAMAAARGGVEEKAALKLFDTYNEYAKLAGVEPMSTEVVLASLEKKL